MRTTLHDIVSVKAIASYKLDHSQTFVRTLIATDAKGNEFELTMFANDANDLTIQSEI